MKTIKSVAKELHSMGGTEKALKVKSKEVKKWLSVGERKSKVIKEIIKIEGKIHENKIKELNKKEASEFGVSVNELFKIKRKASIVLSSFGSSGYKIGDMKTITIYNRKTKKELKIIKDERCYYSRSFKWPAAHGKLNFEITLKDLKKINVMGGIPTILGKKINGKIRKAEWFEAEGRFHNFHIKKVKGFITSDYHAKTISDAFGYRSRKALELLMSRYSKDQNNAKLMELASGKFVGIDHCKKVFCDPGINAFIRRNDLNPKFGYSLGYLMSLNDNSDYVRRLIYV